MVCPKCGQENAAGVRHCEHCGSPLESVPKRQKRKTGKRLAIISAILVLVIVVVACTVSFLSDVQNNEDKYYNSYVESVSYNPDGTSRKTYTKYREDKQVLEELSTDGTLISRNYDESGKLTQLIFNDPESEDSGTLDFTYSVSEDQQVGTATVQLSDGEATIQYIYDMDNHLQEFSVSNGENTNRELYDENGNVTEKFSDGSYTTSIYNLKGNLLYSKTDASDTVKEIKTQYDEDGQTVLKQESYENGNLTYSTVLTEDSRDNKGNGTVKQETHNGAGVYKGYRLIDYHDGVQSKMESYDQNGELQGQWLFDEYGHQTHYTGYYKGNIVYESVSEWTLKES